MSYYGLPLFALRAFEAAARHRSYSRAAEELGLTHGAVSHHIRGLESLLGVPLFNRQRGHMLPTEHGQRLSLHVASGLADLARGVEEVRARSRHSRPVCVSVLPSFCDRWLIPRLGRFHSLHPDIDIKLQSTSALADLAREDIDLALRYGPGRWPGVTSELLLTEVLFPVCSPSCPDLDRARTLSDLLGCHLLHDQRIPWAVWLERLGHAPCARLGRGSVFGDAGLLLRSAEEGHGIALARSALVEAELANGRLVRPLQLEAPAESAYYIVQPADRELSNSARTFKRWLLDAASAAAC